MSEDILAIRAMTSDDIVVIRAMTSDDIASVHAVETECFSMPWSKESFSEEMDNKKAYYFVALWRKEVVGYLGFWSVVGEGYITNVAVKEKFRRRAIGDALIDKAENTAIEMGLYLLTLEVRISNLAAQALYKKHGFLEVGVRYNYYSDTNEDAIIMTKDFIR